VGTCRREGSKEGLGVLRRNQLAVPWPGKHLAVQTPLTIAFSDGQVYLSVGQKFIMEIQVK